MLVVFTFCWAGLCFRDPMRGRRVGPCAAGISEGSPDSTRSNARAQYILGELARRDQNWDEATSRFSQAAKLDPNFAEAYLGWGASLVSDQKYEDAIAPLRIAEHLTPGNPDIHHALATALVRSGHKEEADKEFAIHRRLSSATGA